MQDDKRVQASGRKALNRRAVMRRLGAGSLGLGLLLGDRCFSCVAAAQDGATRPNIILILLDDMRLDDLAVMPATQALLADEGATLTNFFATAPGCGPARASILTGKYPHNHGVLRGNNDLGGLETFIARGNEETTVATWLQAAGYRTALIGKYLNGYREAVPESYVPPGWSDWFGVTQEGYHRFEVNENGEVVKYRAGKEENYSTDVFAGMLDAFVAESTASATPFFAYVAPRAPHRPPEAAARHRDAFAGVEAPRSPAFNEADVSDKPVWIRALPQLDDNEVAELDAYHRLRLQTLLAVDELVAGLIATLEERGALANTYVVFTSDNGFHLGEHRVAREKGSAYEESIHMPLLVRGPGIPAGTVVDALASQADLAPTFADWADVPTPDDVDGRSLAPLLADPGGSDLEWREAVLIEYHADRPPGSTQQPEFQALRLPDLVYVEYGTGERELYDLAADPGQTENLADAADPEQLAALADRVASLRACAGERCRLAEQ
jgi:N-acetylglucosamine-6-sulfatase